MVLARYDGTALATWLHDVKLRAYRHTLGKAMLYYRCVFSMRVEQRFNGPNELVVQTLCDLSSLLQQQLDNDPVAQRPEDADAVDASTYLTLLAAQFKRLERTFADAETNFKRAAGPNGGPDQFAQAYGTLLNDLMSARETVIAFEPPARYAAAAHEFEQFINSLHEQLACWPVRLATAAKNVRGDNAQVSLDVSYDVGPLQRAIGSGRNGA